MYGIDRRLASHDLSSAEGRTRALVDALSVLAPIKESLLAKDYAVQLASRLQMREQDVLDALAKTAAPRTYRNEDAVDKPQMSASQATEIPESEKSRRRFERRLLSLFAQHPDEALNHADSLGNTQWHGMVNAQLAETMLSIMAEQPTISPAALVSRIAEKLPRAAGALTSATVDETKLEEEIAFLIEELEIGDMESTLATMRAQLDDHDGTTDQTEHELMFRATVELQRALTAKRAAHRPQV